MTVTSETAWRQFGDGLREYIARRAPTDAVDDLLGEVFVKVHSRIDTLEDENRLAPWLYQIARNTVTDYHRSRRLTGPTLEDAELPHTVDEPDHAAELAGGLRILIDQLPDGYRQALLLTEFEGMTQAEMGAELGLSVSGAKSRVQRARRLLKDEILACCHLEFDSRGRVIDYEKRARCCAA